MWKKRLMNLFSQFHENADKIPNSKAMGYLPKKWKKKPGSFKTGNIDKLIEKPFFLQSPLSFTEKHTGRKISSAPGTLI